MLVACQSNSLPKSLEFTDKKKNYSVNGKNMRFSYQVTMEVQRVSRVNGLRRLVINTSYWCLSMEQYIPEKSKVDMVDTYKPSKRDVKKHVKGKNPAFYGRLD